MLSPRWCAEADLLRQVGPPPLRHVDAGSVLREPDSAGNDQSESNPRHPRQTKMPFLLQLYETGKSI